MPPLINYRPQKVALDVLFQNSPKNTPIAPGEKVQMLVKSMGSGQNQITKNITGYLPTLATGRKTLYN